MKTAEITFNLFEVITQGKIDILNNWIIDIQKYKTEDDKYLFRYPGSGAIGECMIKDMIRNSWEIECKKIWGYSSNGYISIYALGSKHKDIICFLLENGVREEGAYNLWKSNGWTKIPGQFEEEDKLLTNFSRIIYEQNEIIKNLEKQLENMKNQNIYIENKYNEDLIKLTKKISELENKQNKKDKQENDNLIDMFFSNKN